MPSTTAYDALLPLLTPTNRHRTSSEISDGLKRIRRLVLTEGIPEVVSRGRLAMSLQLLVPGLTGQDGQTPLRPKIWKLMLKVDKLDSHEYLRYVSLGPSSVSNKSAL